jgi:hypothetical protein
MARETFPFAAEIPKARFHENDSPNFFPMRARMFVRIAERKEDFEPGRVENGAARCCPAATGGLARCYLALDTPPYLS